MPLFGVSPTGKLFSPEHPGWHDPKRAPGATPLLRDDVTGRGFHTTSGWWYPIVTLQALFLSPNLVWLAISLAMYIGVPYELEAPGGPRDGWALSWVLPRFYLNCGVTMLYVGYWYVTLYHCSFGQRKFRPDRSPGLGRMIHNMWYTFLGAAQWSVWEVVFMRLWASGTLPYVTDASALSLLSSPATVAKMLFWVAAVPVFREFHFYWAHRMLHFRVLYRFVHSLHHRNVDPEPFSGLCMHPVEHLYYLATVLPSVVLTLSPFHFLWNGMHAVISPAAGHSGWEDHWQSDQFHYIHHAKFECNYGGGGIPVDAWFGTLRDTLSGTDRLYKGASTGGESALLAEAGADETAYRLSRADDDPAAKTKKTKRAQNQPAAAAGAGSGGSKDYQLPALATLNPLPKFADFCYLLGCVAVCAVGAAGLLCGGGGFGIDYQQQQQQQQGAACEGAAGAWGGRRLLAAMDARLALDHRTTVPLVVAWGPVCWGVVCNCLLRDKFSFFWPFHKDPLLRTLLHLAVGTVFCQCVVYQSLAMYLRSPYLLPTPVLAGSAGWGTTA